MTPPRTLWNRIVIVMLLAVLGCSTSRTGNGGDPQRSKMLALSNAYARFQIEHQGGYPQSEEDFKEFIRQSLQGLLDRTSIHNVDDLFISDRDDQPYVVLYGQQAANSPRGIVAYEKQGAGSVRFVAFSAGSVGQLSDVEFQAFLDAPR